MQDSIERLRARGAADLLLSQEPKVGAHGTPVVFLRPKAMGGVLVELEETAPLGTAAVD